MVKTVFLLLSFITLPLHAFAAGKTVDCELSVYQHEKSQTKPVLIWCDTVIFFESISAIGSLGPVSLELELLKVDTGQVQFNAHVVTIDPPATIISRHFSVEYSLPAKIDGLKGKRDIEYTVALTPLAFSLPDTSYCDYNHRERGAFTFQPTAHFDIYYVPGSLSDYYFDSIKELMENYFRQFQSFANFNLPGKMLLYVAPCPVSSVIWDQRFGMGFDPSRNAAFAVYNKDFNSADPFIAANTAVLRHFGYAPAFLSEGYASYFSFAACDMKKILRENRQLALAPLLQPLGYQRADAFVADRTAATFAKYLIDHYGLDSFMKLYKQSDDLHLEEQLQSVYAKPISTLEKEWRIYIDTLNIPAQEYELFANQAEMMLDYQLLREYAQGFLEASRTKPDSIRALNLLKRAFFFEGNYYQATDYQQQVLALDSENSQAFMSLGSYRMMNGEYEAAEKDFREAQKRDSANYMIRFNLALCRLYQDDTASARKLLTDNLAEPNMPNPSQGESRAVLGELLAQSSDPADKKAAEKYFRETIGIFGQSLQLNNASSTLYLWSAIGYMGIREFENAQRYLEIADFLETRPFYSGMIALYLGKVLLAQKKYDEAEGFLSRVSAMPSAVYHQTEAKRLLKNLNN